MLFNDQFLIEKSDGKCISDLKEGLILFPPTYKLKTNSNTYTHNDKDFRIPGWTDRILF